MTCKPMISKPVDSKTEVLFLFVIFFLFKWYYLSLLLNVLKVSSEFNYIEKKVHMWDGLRPSIFIENIK